MADSQTSPYDGHNKILKSTLIFKLVEGSKYVLKISNTKTSAVTILKKADSISKPTWLVRFDHAHKNVPYTHVNVRHALTGIKDPHAKLPKGALTVRSFDLCFFTKFKFIYVCVLQVVQGSAYLAKAMSWLCYASLLYDGTQLACSVHKDYQEGTIQNTKECATQLTGQYVGGTIGRYFPTYFFYSNRIEWIF